MNFITKEAPMSQAVNTQKALAVAFMADRLNKGYVKETRRFSEDVPTVFANKEIVKFFFTEEHNFTPNDYVKAIPNDDDFDSVDIAQKHFRRYSMEKNSMVVKYLLKKLLLLHVGSNLLNLLII